MEWYEIPPEKRTDEQAQRAQQAYYLALLSTREGREVICDMKMRVAELVEGAANDTNCAVAQLWLEAFLKDTLILCGVSNYDPIRIVETEAEIAKSYIHKEKEKNPFEDFAE
jgi:hypothetical protein